MSAVHLAFAIAGPPVPPSLDETDPLVRSAVRTALGSVESDPSVGSWLTLAQTLDANNFISEAEQCYEQVVALDPASVRAWYLLGIVRYDLGDLDGALDALDEAALRDQSYAPIEWRRGYMLLDDGQIEEAARAFDSVRAEEPAKFGMARVALARRNAVEARKILEPLVQSGRNVRYALRLMAAVHAMSGEPEEAGVAMSVGAGATPSWIDPWLADVHRLRTGYDALMERIRDLTDSGRNDEAIVLVQQLLRDRPDDVNLLNFLGYAHVNEGRRDQGIHIWEEALQRHPDSYLLHLNLGAVFAEDALRNNLPTDRAEQHLDDAIASNPGHARTFEVRGTLRSMLGRVDDAVVDLERAFALDPTNANVARQLTQLYMRTYTWHEAERVLRRWVRLEPQSPQAWLSLAIALMNQDRLDEADEAFERGASLLPPGHTQVNALRAELKHRRER